ncbi:hypothetical protein LL998_30220 [Burkholderia ambifaria]|uniref:hypothetical protein n=1 Tax=Burkholderia ambifaria TaxID=152480 RepID=UPI001E28E24B|nr:hypothetical protein [Burkholderia ambifaria]UEP39522.1 hypothetical protein LL998_30220 [Burkholderia ambifaria]
MFGYANRPALRTQLTTALPFGQGAARYGAALSSVRYWYDKNNLSPLIYYFVAPDFIAHDEIRVAWIVNSF